ncbi:MAG: hypothetical protein Q4C65_10385, partial [Eubacteriales bacterium]|nr:hypothetical protein [Eubacteriales bacterium]
MRKKTGKMRFLSVLLSLSLMFQTGAFVSDGIPGGTAYAQEALPGEDSEKDTETTEAAAGEITETTTEETTGTASGETTETTTEETTA